MFSLYPILSLMGQIPEEGATPVSSTGFIDSWSDNASQGNMLSNVIYALMAVMALIFVAAWLLKRFYPMGGKRSGYRKMKVLESLPLGRKRMLQVLKVYDRTLVIGVTSDRIDLLTEISEDDEVSEPEDDVKDEKSNKKHFGDICPFRTKKETVGSVGGEGN